MKKRQHITYQAAGIPKTTTISTCLCFRVTTSTPTLNSTLSLCLSVARVMIFSALFVNCSAVGYSYSRFEGPVVGPEQLVTLPDAYGGGTHSDYVARPEYSFAYGIEDGETRVLQNRKETRNGDEVRGVYSVVDPDGTLRVVKYTADDANGFQAEVITNGVARLHGHGDGGGGAAVDEQVEHNEVNHQAANDDEDDEENEEDTPQKGKGQYKVHEDYDEEEGDHDGGGEEGEEKEGGGDHEEYEGSSEEGYEDAKPQEEQESSEEY